jgi:hypothetical protein
MDALPEKMDNTGMDEEIMKDVDKWWHFLIATFWTERNQKRFNRIFKNKDQRDVFLMSFAYEKLNRLEDVANECHKDIDELKEKLEEVRNDLTRMESKLTQVHLHLQFEI